MKAPEKKKGTLNYSIVLRYYKVQGSKGYMHLTTWTLQELLMAREQSGMLGSKQEVYYFQGSSTAHPTVCITTYTCTCGRT